MYTDTFKIFYDTFGGDRFGVVWDPSLKEPRPFRVLGGFSSQPVKKVIIAPFFFSFFFDIVVFYFFI